MDETGDKQLNVKNQFFGGTSWDLIHKETATPLKPKKDTGSGAANK